MVDVPRREPQRLLAPRTGRSELQHDLPERRNVCLAAWVLSLTDECIYLAVEPGHMYRSYDGLSAIYADS